MREREVTSKFIVLFHTILFLKSVSQTKLNFNEITQKRENFLTSGRLRKRINIGFDIMQIAISKILSIEGIKCLVENETKSEKF